MCCDSAKLGERKSFWLFIATDCSWRKQKVARKRRIRAVEWHDGGVTCWATSLVHNSFFIVFLVLVSLAVDSWKQCQRSESLLKAICIHICFELLSFSLNFRSLAFVSPKFSFQQKIVSKKPDYKYFSLSTLYKVLSSSEDLSFFFLLTVSKVGLYGLWLSSVYEYINRFD